MRKSGTKKLNYLFSFVIGISIIGMVLRYIGIDSLKSLFTNLHPFYLFPYILATTMLFVVNALRLQVVLGAYDKKVGFWPLFKQGIAGYAVSYITPSARIGGEPLKIYMMKKENDVDYRSGSSAVIIDKFIELLGSALFGIVGLVLLFFLPSVPFSIKITLGIILAVSFLLLSFVYFFTIIGKGPFSSIFNLFKFSKNKKWNHPKKAIVDVEKKMEKFFRHHQTQFWVSLFFYGLFGFFTILEIKFLFLVFGIKITIVEAILSIVVLGVINFVPVPAGVGFQEAGQVGLFALLRGSGELGVAFMLLERLRGLIFTAIGFAITFNFGGKQLIKKFTKEKS